MPKTTTPFDTAVFSESSRKAKSLICTILRYEDDQVVYDSILGLILKLTPILGVGTTKIDVCNFISPQMKEQLDEFLSLELFKYPSYLFFMFVCQNYEHFHNLGLKRLLQGIKLNKLINLSEKSHY